MTEMSVRGRSAPQRPANADESASAKANSSPSGATVTSTLSEDTITATHMLTSSGRGAAAPFSNPFAGGAEEMLYIDVAGQLIWLHHAGQTGWQLEVIASSADQVVVAVHPNGTVCAFALVGGQKLDSWRLEQGPENPRWVAMPTVLPAFESARSLSIQYVNDRPSTVFVFVLDQGGLRPPWLYAARSVVASTIDPPPDPKLFHILLQVPWVDAPTSGDLVVGVDAFEGTVEDLRTFWIQDDGLYMGEWTTEGVVESLVSAGVTSLVGPFSGPGPVGCIALGPDTQDPLRQAVVSYAPGVAGVPGNARRTRLDRILSDAVGWQDQDGRMHVFGTATADAGGRALHVLHQTSLIQAEGSAGVLPVWETVPLGTGYVALTRPLIPDVRDFAVDAYPDEYPSQHVMHANGRESERCALYTQDVRSTWWSREIVRLPANVKPYKVTRYKSEVTLTNSFGHPVPNYPVKLTSDRPLDLEIKGHFYRTGPDLPVDVGTDYQGKLTLKVAARGLAGNTLHLSALGLADGVVINPAAPLHAFLSSAGTLPNHPDGISADGLRNAKTSDGKYLVPAWHAEDHGLAAVPEPQEVVAWCAFVFQAQRGLLTAQASGAGGGTSRVRLIQTWDASRPAYEIVDGRERLDELGAARRAHPRYAGTLADWGLSPGDIWQGLIDGLVTVVETVLDLDERIATLLIQWADEGVVLINLALDTVEDAAVYVESVFVSIGAEVRRVLDWLTWPFDFDDIMLTQRALLDAMDQLPAYLTKTTTIMFDQVAHGWFVEQEKNVKDYFAKIRPELTGVTLGSTPPAKSKEATTVAAGTPALPEIVTKPDQMSNGHTNWMMEQITLPTSTFSVRSADGDVPPEFQPALDAFEALFAVFDDPGVGAELSKALKDFSELVTGLFDFSDPTTFARTEIGHVLDLAEDIVRAILTFCDAAVRALSAFIIAAVHCLSAALDMKAFDADGPLGLLWEFICDAAGIPVTSPTLGDFFALAAAFPLTLVYKAAAGATPFPEGTFPRLDGGKADGGTPRSAMEFWPPGSAFTAPGDYPIPPLEQTIVQILVGVSTCIFAAVDAYCDKPHEADPGVPTADDSLIMLIVFFDLIAFAVGDLPVLWGADNIWNVGEPEIYWYAEYFSKLPIYLGDLVVGIVKPFLKAGTVRSICGALQDPIGNTIINLFGLVETGFSITLMAKSRGHVMDWMWVVTQILGLVSSDTAIWRIIPGLESTLEYKLGVDVVCDLVDGGMLTAMATTATLDSLGRLSPNIRSVGVVGSPYGYSGESYTDRERPSFPPYGWAITSGSLPPGLNFTLDPEYPQGEHVLITGIPTQAGTFTFTVLSVNSYDPNIPRSRTFDIEIVP